MHQVTIEPKASGFGYMISLDGQDIGKVVSAADVRLRGAEPPTITLQMLPLSDILRFDQADITLSDLKMPEAAERLLLAHLKAKYERG